MDMPNDPVKIESDIIFLSKLVRSLAQVIQITLAELTIYDFTLTPALEPLRNQANEIIRILNTTTTKE